MTPMSTTRTGIVYPFVREAEDFASGSGPALVRSNVSKVVAVKAASGDGLYRGEYPWRLDLGSEIDRIRHGNYGEFTADLIRLYLSDAVARWEPGASIETRNVRFERRDDGHLLVAPIGSQGQTAPEGDIEVPI
jgi:hypothetical protein